MIAPETIASWIAIATAAGGAVVWVWRAGQRETVWRARLDKRVNTLWSFHMARGYAEAISTGHAKQAHDRSLTVTPEVRELLDPIGGGLRDLFQRNPTMSRDDMLELIENRFSSWLVDNVCIPLGIYHGACLQLAYEVASRHSALDN